MTTKKPKVSEDVQHFMPQEVKDWIEKASSKMNFQTGEIQRLKDENLELKAYKKWAENRILSNEID